MPQRRAGIRGGYAADRGTVRKWNDERQKLFLFRQGAPAKDAAR